jgi:hypothetical protein
MTRSKVHEEQHNFRRRLFILLMMLGTVSGCHRAGSPHHEASSPSPSEEPQDAPWFVDVTEEAGLNFLHDAGSSGRHFLPEIIGSGAALFDFDNDGLLDIYLVQNGGPQSRSTNRLFRQGPKGRFTDVSKGSGLDVTGYGMGVAVGDVNNDGWPDVLVTEYGRVRLFLNNGNGTFTEIGREAGLDSLLWGTSACFMDYDRDGWLDLVVVDYVAYDPARRCADPDGRQEYCGPNAFSGTVTRLYRNRGPMPGAKPNTVRFEDVTLESGLGRQPGPGLGVFCADFNGDRWPDIFVANDGKPNHLWINQRDGTFKEEAVERGLAYNCLGRAEANMGVAIGDVDGDGLFDLFVTHLTDETNTLWTQGPRGMFQDRTAAVGLANPHWRGTGFGTLLADFDHDGALDLAVVNGRVKRGKLTSASAETRAALGPHWSVYAERNQVFVNDGHGRFRDISIMNVPFCGTPHVCRGLVCGDIDNDGALDLLVTAVADRTRLYRNVAPKRGHWLLVRAVDPALHRDAYGAEIKVQAGGRRWMRWINPGYSYLCSNDPRAHFGLGEADRVDSIEVVWPDGSEETYPGRPADQFVVLRKGEGHAPSRRPVE